MTTLTVGEQFANAVADQIAREMFSPHRGVIEVRSPFFGRCFAAFGNDGYSQDDRTRTYVDELLQELGRHDPVFGKDSAEGYTWVIIVPFSDDTHHVPFLRAALTRELYLRYCRARGVADDDGFVLCRRSICDREIIEHTNGESLTISGWESVN